MMDGEHIYAAALALVGTRFRLHGRDPATGLDCIGLAVAAFGRAGCTLTAPVGYGLRNLSINAFLSSAVQPGLEPVSGPAQPGDLQLVQPGPAQHHLLIAGPDGSAVHAHAGLGRVVHSPAPLVWPVIAHWRARPGPSAPASNPAR